MLEKAEAKLPIDKGVRFAICAACHKALLEEAKMTYTENWVEFKDGKQVVFINNNKRNHFLLRPGETLILDNLGMPQEKRIVCRILKITYETWLKKIKEA